MLSNCDVWMLNIVWFVVICLILSTLLCPYDYYNNDPIDMFMDSSCADPNSILIDNTCYGCPNGYLMNTSTLQCYSASNVCVDPNSVMINNTCYGCIPGYKYDSTLQKCLTVNPVNVQLPAPLPTPASATISYTCLNENDILNGTTCYNCISKNSKLDSSLQCQNILNAYYPKNYYTSTSSSCSSGYIYDYGICYQCEPNDTYMSGHGCVTTQSSAPVYSYPATMKESSFDRYNLL